MANIVITGATGFVGGYLVREALAKGHTVFALGREQKSLDSLRQTLPAPLQDRLNLVATEITPENTPFLEHLFQENQIDTVIHAAGQASVGKSFAEIAEQKESYEMDPRIVRNTPTGISNIQTTEVLLRAMKQIKNKPHFHLVSTGDVFSQEANDIINEQSVRRANTPYGWTKQFAEMVINKAVDAGDVTASITYGPLIFGPYQRSIALLPIISEQFIKGQPVILRGDPLRETDAIDVRDFAKIVIRASTLDHAQKRNLERYVISGHRTTIKEIFDRVVQSMNLYMPQNPALYKLDSNYVSPSDKQVDDSYAKTSFPDIYAELIPLGKTIEDIVISKLNELKTLIDESQNKNGTVYRSAGL